MPFQSKFSSGSNSSSGFSSRRKKESTGFDLNTTEGLIALAKSRGLTVEEPKKKLSILQRLGRGLSALEPSDAFYHANYEGKNFVVEYLKDVFYEGGSAITGKELRPGGEQKKTFKDILLKNGMTDREGKIDPVDVLGFAGDVVTDPGTWFGSQIAKGAGKIVGTGLKGAEKVGMKIAPMQTETIKKAGEAISVAGKSFFAPEKLMSKGLPDDIVGLQNESMRIFNEKGTEFKTLFKGLTKEVQDDFTNGMFNFNKKFAQTRELNLKARDEMIANEINDTISQIRKTTRELRANQNLTQDTLKQIQKLESDLSSRSTKLREDMGAYLSDEAATSIGTTRASAKTIPPEFQSTAYQANKFKTFKEFSTSEAGRMAHDLELRGELDAFGIDTAENFYKYAKGEYKPATTSIRVKEPRAKYYKSQAELEQLVAKKRSILPEEYQKILDDTEDLTSLKIPNKKEVAKVFKEIKSKARDTLRLDEEANKLGALKLSKQQEEIYRMESKLGEIKDLDLPSYVDAIRATQRQVDTLLDKKEEWAQKAKDNFDYVTQTMVKEFNAISPEKIFENPQAVRFFVDKMLPVLKKQKLSVEEATGMKAEMLLTAYFPMIDKRTLKGFVQAGTRVGKEGGTKRRKGLIEWENLLTDAPTAYARRYAEVVRDKMTRTSLQRWVKRYGEPLEKFANEKDAAEAGFKLLREKGIYGKEVGWLKDWDHKAVTEIFDPSYEMLDQIAKATGFDAVTGATKIALTGLFPSFHARNFVSGVIQNFEVLGIAALRPSNIAMGIKYAKKLGSKDLSGVINLGGKTFKVEGLMKSFMRRFGYSSQYFADIGWDVDKLVMKESSKLNPITHARSVGNFIEMQQKMTVYLGAIKKGYTKAEALKLTEKAGFDYSRLSPFEKHVMRRLIPFYAFSRKNLELQLETLAKHPQRLGTITKAGRSLGTPTGLQEREGDNKLPDWMANSFVASFGKNQFGLPQVLSGFGTPIEEQAQLYEKGIMGLLSRLNPILRVPLERAIGKDFFYERDLSTIYNADEYAMLPKPLKDWLDIHEVEVPIYRGGKKTSETRTQYRADPARLHIARNLFTSRGFSYLHTLFGNEELTQEGRILKSLTGIKAYELDQEEIKYFENRENSKAILDLMRRLNIAKSYEQIYENKK